MDQETYYIVRDKVSGNMARGTRGYGGYGGGTVRSGPPKLYKIGQAKGLKTTKAIYGMDLEIIPVTIIYGDPLE